MTRENTNGSIIAEITIQAPADRIFDALADPAQRLQWWARSGRFSPVSMDSDLRPGGNWVMHFEHDGTTATVAGEYVTIDPPRTLEFTWCPSWDPSGARTLVRFDLIEQNGTTMVRVRHSGLADDAARARHSGWPDLLAALRSYAQTSESRA